MNITNNPQQDACLSEAAKFFSQVRPDLWDFYTAFRFINKSIVELDNGDSLGTGGFTISKNEYGDVSVSLDLATLYADGDAQSWMLEEYRDKFKI